MMVSRPPTFFFLRFGFALARRRRPPSKRKTETQKKRWRETIFRAVHAIIRVVQVILRAVHAIVRVDHSMTVQHANYDGKPSADILFYDCVVG